MGPGQVLRGLRRGAPESFRVLGLNIGIIQGLGLIGLYRHYIGAIYGVLIGALWGLINRGFIGITNRGPSG